LKFHEIRKHEILRHEFVGMEVDAEIGSIRHSLPFHGKIIYETKNCIILRENGNAKILPKKSIRTLKIKIKDSVCFIKGSSLLGKPEDRIFRT